MEEISPGTDNDIPNRYTKVHIFCECLRSAFYHVDGTGQSCVRNMRGPGDGTVSMARRSFAMRALVFGRLKNSSGFGDI